MKKLFFASIFFLLVVSLIISKFFYNTLLLTYKHTVQANNQKDFSILILGKPGPGYVGSENTDSIIVVNFVKDKKKIFLIPIPRDLIIQDENGNLEKINALYGEKNIKLLLNKASFFTGLAINNFLVVDIRLIKKIVDFLGGIEIILDSPVVDAVSFYALPKGKVKLDGELTELVLRSRFNAEGDFFRIKNQIKVIQALQQKILALNFASQLQLLTFIFNNKYDWETNMRKEDILVLFNEFRNEMQNISVTPIIVDLKSGVLKSGYFTIKNFANVYGIYPLGGVDHYIYVQTYIKAQMK